MPDINNLKISQAAGIIGCSVPTLRKHILKRTGPKFFRIGNGPRGSVRYRLQDIEEWIQNRLQQ